MSDRTEVVCAVTARHPLAFGVLYAHGIDAGCTRCTLERACDENGLQPDAVLDEIARAERELGGRWASRPVTALVEHVLRTYHRAFASEMAAAERAFDAARPSCDDATWSELRQELAELRADMEQHMTKEEHVLFPWLRSRADTAAAPIRVMQLEHADTLSLLHSVHAAGERCLGGRSDAPAREARERLAHLERALCEHVHLEDNELFPRALDSSAGR